MRSYRTATEIVAARRPTSDLGRVQLSVSVEHVRWRGREARENDNGILRVTTPTVLSGFQDSFNADSLLNLQ